jgi:hypothetical protein
MQYYKIGTLVGWVGIQGFLSHFRDYQVPLLRRFCSLKKNRGLKYALQLAQEQNRKTMQTFLTVIGAVVVAYVGVRIFATGVDIFQRWRSGNWEV